MLNQTQSEIAVRLFDNNTYGTTYGKGLYRKAIYNGTIDAKAEGAKYLVDLYSYDEWANMAKTDEQMAILANVEAQSDALYSWVQHYDLITKDKTTVPGMCRLDIESLDITVLICDEEHGMTDTWELKAKPCRQGRAGVKTPQLLATNADLSGW
jgi:arabinogalactan endo-1,4-beta-galactosidase